MKQLKNGKMKSLYKRNLLALYLLLAFALVLFGTNLGFQFNYIRNYLSDGYELDPASLRAAVGYRTIEPQTLTSEEAGLIVALKDSQTMFYDDYVYYQDKDYRFSVTVDEVYDAGIGYSYDLVLYYYEMGGNFRTTTAEEAFYTDRVLLLRSGDLVFIAIVDGSEQIQPGDTIVTVFTQMGEYVIHDLGYILNMFAGEGYDILSYYADLRGIPVEYEDEDWKFTIGYGLIVLLTAVIALVFTFMPYSHPFYRQLLKYGGDRDELIDRIDGELGDESKLTKKGKYHIGNEWMYKYSLFMSIIEKNPDYVPEQQRDREDNRYKYKNQYRRYRGDGKDE